MRWLVIGITIITSASFFVLALLVSSQNSSLLRRIGLNVRYWQYAARHNVTDAPIITEKATSIPILVYHGIVENPDRFSLTKERFVEHMVQLKKAGYQTISPEDFIAFINKKKTLPAKSFLLTFDDGRKDSYYGADPILRVLGFQAVMFIATYESLEVNESDYYLNTRELRAMTKSGRWFVESHGVQENGGFIPINAKGEQGNFLSNKKWLADMNRLETNAEYEARVAYELAHAKQSIESAFGTTVTLMSYPFSDYGQQTVNQSAAYAERIIKREVEKNYQAAFRQVWPAGSEYLFNTQNENPFRLKRLEPSPITPSNELLELLDNGAPKKLPFTDIFSTDLGWKNAWGNIFQLSDKKQLELKSDPKRQTGAFAYLDGSAEWTKYFFTASLSFENSKQVALIARFQNQGNYVRCFYDQGIVKLESLKNNKRKIIASSSQEKIALSTQAITLGVAVSGNEVHCTVNGEDVAKGLVPITDIPKNGGIAIIIWPDEKNTPVVVRKVSVHPITSNIPNTIKIHQP